MTRTTPGNRRENDRIVTKDDLAVALGRVVAAVPQLRRLRNQMRNANLGMNIEWGSRQQLRTIEGHVTKSIEACGEFLGSLGTDDAEDAIDKLWPER